MNQSSRLHKLFLAGALFPRTSLSHHYECIENTEVCKDPGASFQFPILDLSRPGPTIDSYFNISDYEDFLAVPMFNAGNNGPNNSNVTDAPDQIATAYLGYENSPSHKLCVAAKLNEDFMSANPTVQLIEPEEAWVFIGNVTGKKLNQLTEPGEFAFLTKNGLRDGVPIGFEACWPSIYDDPLMPSIFNNFMEVHFNKGTIGGEGQTTSTGKDQSNGRGRLICLLPVNCDDASTTTSTTAANSATTTSTTPGIGDDSDTTSAATTTTAGRDNDTGTSTTTTTTITITERPETTTTTTTTEMTTSTTEATTTTTVPQTTTTTTVPETTTSATTTTPRTGDELTTTATSATNSPTNSPTTKPTCDYATIDAIRNEITISSHVEVVISVLDNDVPAQESYPLTITHLVYAGAFGKCTITPTDDGKTITYEPLMNFYGSDTCIYTACDTAERCDSAAVNIHYDDDSIIARDDYFTTDKGTMLTITTESVLANDTAHERHPLTVVTVSSTDINKGTCHMINSTTIIYVPEPDHQGLDYCSYKACDDRGACDTAVIIIFTNSTPCDDDPDVGFDSTSPTSSPTASPTSCGPRSLFFYSGGVCTNSYEHESDSVYRTMQDCCNENFHDSCCQFVDVCYNPGSPQPQPDDPNTNDCFELWQPRVYRAGERVTGRNGRNYACNADYFLYCSWAEFEPGTDAYPNYSELAWDELPSICHSDTPVTAPTPTAPTSCPGPYDKVAHHYVAGDRVTYSCKIFQCMTSNGRCNQDGYEPWSSLTAGVWNVIGSCPDCGDAPATSPSPTSTVRTPITQMDLPICPPYFDKFAHRYVEGDQASYNGTIYQCMTSNGRCFQDGYEVWSPLADGVWLIVGLCQDSYLRRGRRAG